MKIEICANSYESALNAQRAGADRIELCTQLSVGGLTPSYGLISKVKEELSIPVHVLIRPRAGGFNYTKEEIDIMIRDIKFCNKIGCDGVVSGVLNEDKSLNIIATKQLIDAAGTLMFTFHRAIDLVTNPIATLKQLEKLGITRVLSSGQQPRAIDGLKTLNKLLKTACTIQIMPGSGINIDNALNFKKAGFETLHFSAINKVKETLPLEGVTFKKGMEGTSDENKIREVIKLVNK